MPNGEEIDRSFFCRHFTTFTRVLGVATSIALWWIGILLTDKADKRIAVYLLICAFVVSFLEVIFILDRCAICKEGHFGFTLWNFLKAIDTWKKFVLYGSLSIVCYLHPKEFWEAVIIGVFLDVLAIFYLMHTFRKKNERAVYRYRQLEIK
ncbi:transmembrane protein 72 [Exaiptasia diaphana]|uniref:Transmembrane protein 72 n=1 Tax=Exaiptasia diaphana TaxID=2652724 RepID=A0A913XYQ8_EXADI|nr:transmembrane protein 72 [Exaiptasia diaphana]KXJ08229.1 Transmembrane protein 72 [Exaiptasia diaphana]